MNIYLSINNREKEIQIPVLPSSFSIQSNYSNQRIETVTHDEIMHVGNKQLTTIAFSSFFPIKDDSFLKSKDMFGWDYVKTIAEFRASKKPIRLVITGTNINSPMVITNFEYAVQDGTGDIYYSLGLEEYKFVDIQKLEAVPIIKPKPVIVEETKKTSSSGGSGNKTQATKGKYSTSTNTTVKDKGTANGQVAKYNSIDKVSTNTQKALTNEQKVLSGQADRIEGQKAGTIKLQQEHKLSEKAKDQMSDAYWIRQNLLESKKEQTVRPALDADRYTDQDIKDAKLRKKMKK